MCFEFCACTDACVVNEHIDSLHYTFIAQTIVQQIYECEIGHIRGVEQYVQVRVPLLHKPLHLLQLIHPPRDQDQVESIIGEFK
jgi:hypothetical protein